METKFFLKIKKNGAVIFLSGPVHYSVAGLDGPVASTGTLPWAIWLKKIVLAENHLKHISALFPTDLKSFSFDPWLKNGIIR